MFYLCKKFLDCVFIIINNNSFLVTAAVAIANVVKSSLGLVGLDKMLVDDVGVIFLVRY